jgi:hypothetical protein
MKMWRCRDGRKIRIKDMTDSHLRNTVNMLNLAHRNLVDNTSYPCFQGEMAQMYAESEWDVLQESDPFDYFPILGDLTDEMEKRGIK